jgi:cytochrome c1
MAKRLITLLAAAIAAVGIGAGTAHAAGEAKEPRSVDWSYAGPFGTFDRHQLQRGFQVYKEVCAACHGLEYVPFRTLTEIGFTEDQVKAIAAEYTVQDGPDDFGEMFDRPAKLFDYLPSPFPNEKAAAAAWGIAPPDLSLMNKARPNGDNYVYSLLTGYVDDGEDHGCSDTNYYNPYFPGGCLSMPNPLVDGLVEYVDGTEATADQMSRDVTAFMMWTAEPKMEERKQMGVKVILFLIFLSVLLYLAKRQIWGRLH